MYTTWIEGCTVQRMSLQGDLVLNFDDANEVVISCLLWLALPANGEFPAEEVLIDPREVAAHQRPLLDLAGAVCTKACHDDSGRLHLSFSNGLRIEVSANERATAWELYGKHHGYMACLPHGRVKVVRHDIPYDEDDNAGATTPN